MEDIKKQTLIHIDELGASPGMNDVSKVAMGGHATTMQAEEEENEKKASQRFGGDKKCMDINDAYAQLFESLAVILKK